MENNDRLKPVRELSERAGPRTADEDRLGAAGEALIEQVERALPTHRPSLARQLRGTLVDEIDGHLFVLEGLGNEEELAAITENPWYSMAGVVRSGATAAFVADIATWWITLTVILAFMMEVSA